MFNGKYHFQLVWIINIPATNTDGWALPAPTTHQPVLCCGDVIKLHTTVMFYIMDILSTVRDGGAGGGSEQEASTQTVPG